MLTGSHQTESDKERSRIEAPTFPDGRLSEPDAKKVLERFGIAVPVGVVADNRRALEQAITSLRPPYALKLISPDVVHKTDVGAIAIDLASPAAVFAAADAMMSDVRLQSAELSGFLVEQMVPGSVELALGGVVDPNFGPVMMLGLGGIFVEVLKDVAFRICPVSARDVREMLSELKGFPLLQGARGGFALDLGQLVTTALAVGGQEGLLMQCQSELLELDINPLLVGADIPVAADARIVLRKKDAA